MVRTWKDSLRILSVRFMEYSGRLYEALPSRRLSQTNLRVVVGTSADVPREFDAHETIGVCVHDLLGRA